MNHIFSEVPTIKVPRSLFRRDHGLKTTIGASYLYPIYCDEALPADTFKFKQHLFGRLNTPVVPVMDNVYLDTFYFAVPIRLIWDDWQKFMGERPFGDSTTVYTVPSLTTTSASDIAVGTLSDYLGIPPGVSGITFNTLWHRSYNLIFNEWFRDESLVPPIPVGNKTETSNTHTESLSDYVLRKRGKRHDYFTSCLPWPQKGDQPSISLLGEAPIISPNNSPLNVNFHNLSETVTIAQGEFPRFAEAVAPLGTTQNLDSSGTSHPAVKAQIIPSQLTKIKADLSGIGVVQLNTIREGFALQHYFERLALSGSRYIEQIRGLFGVISPDARMQRPEYLGGSSVPISFTTVPATSYSGGDEYSSLGFTGAFATVNSTAAWSKSFTEHCIIIGLANVRADLSYSQGLPRMFSRRTRYDFYLPQLANLGEQAVLNKEIFAQGTSADDDVFGYQERWAEYRYHPSMLTSYFRTGNNAYDYWHLAQRFANLPTLSQTFIEENVPLDRILSVQGSASNAHVFLDGWFELECARPMPLYSVPGLTRL